MANKNTKDMMALMETYSTSVGNLNADSFGDGTVTDDTGPEAAEGFEKETPEMLKEPDSDVKNQEKTEKLAKENINTLNTTTMNDKNENIFDKLYQSLMEGDELPSMDEDPFGSEGEDVGDDLGLDDGGDKISIELDRDVAEKLHQALGDLLSIDGDSELEDLDGEDESDPFGGGSDSPFEDSIQVVAEPQNLPDSNLKSGNNSNKQNKVKAAGYSGKGGKATTGKIPDVVADPKDLPETNLKSGNNSSMGSNKVQSPGTNQGEFIK